MQAFLINLLVGSFFGEGTASANFQVNNSGVCEKLSACVGISSLGDLVGKSCIYNLRFVLTEVIICIPSPKQLIGFLNVFKDFRFYVT